MEKSYTFLYFKVKRLSPSFGGAARFIPRNIEKGWKNHILSYILKKSCSKGCCPLKQLIAISYAREMYFPSRVSINSTSSSLMNNGTCTLCPV